MSNKFLQAKVRVRPFFILWLTAMPLLFWLLMACAGPAAQPEVAAQPTIAPTEAATPVEAAPSPTTAPSTNGPGAGDTLRILIWQAPTTINPHLAPGQKDQIASRITYEPLASYNAEGEMIPFLAAKIPSLENGGVAADGKSVTWTLKQGIKWSDGEPFTADDVLFTYEYLTNPAVGASTVSEYDAVKRVEVMDDHTVKINFKDVNPAWSLPFVGIKGMIIPRHIFKDYNGSNAPDAPVNLAPVGTGPYRVIEFKKEDVLIIGEDAVNTIKIIYEPNPYFREADKLFFSRVEVQGGGDAKAAAQAVQDGLVDFAFGLQVDNNLLEQIEGAGKGKVVKLSGAVVERIMINFTDPHRATTEGEQASVQFPHPFFNDKKVRQALALAIDREAIAKLYGPTGEATANLLVSPPTYASPNTYYKFDLDKAAALLNEAGWVDSDGDGIRDKEGVKLSVVFQTSVNEVRQKTQEIIKAALEKIGFKVELKFIDSSIFFSSDVENTNTRSHFYADLEEFATDNKSPDPGAYMTLWVCDQAAQKANNWGKPNISRYCNPTFDDLYRQSLTELNPEKRRQLIVQMNELLSEDVAVIPLIHRADTSGISNSLEGFEPTPWDREVWNIKDWRRK